MGLFARVIPAPFRRLARTWLERNAFERKLAIATPVLILQMGKVGSLSVHVPLSRSYPDVVVHAHHFAADHPDAAVRRLHRWAREERRPLYVISLTREPVARNVSAFFQNFEREVGLPFARSTHSIADLRTIFFHRYDHDLPLRWFDRQIAATFGIDVFSRTFPNAGFDTYMQANVRLHVMRSETPDETKASAINTFLGIDKFAIEPTNIGARKEYAEIYQEFKNGLVLPPALLAKIRESKYYKHFYA